MDARRFAALAALPICLAFAACEERKHDDGHGHEHLDLGKGLHAFTVVEKLKNPSSVSVDADGRVTICDSGNGRVLVIDKGKTKQYITDFKTEFWKVGKDGAPDRFKLGPLSALWADPNTLVVSNAGLKDGEDNILFFGGSGKASDGEASNAIPPTSKDEADKGEGNFTGFSLAADGAHVWVCGQGADAKTWLCRLELSSKRLETFASADDHGIAINSPMDTLPWNEDSVLVLYSGAGGKEDGLIVQWSIKDRKPMAQWTLPGLIDPMGMAKNPKAEELLVVDNNWSLTEVKKGVLARVSLPADGGKAKVTIVTDKLRGPVDCCFDQKGTLYVAQLGEEFDKDKGSVIAIEGL